MSTPVRRRYSVAALAAALLCAIPTAARSATPGATVLSAPNQFIRWSGSAAAGPPNAPVPHTPDTCAAVAQVGACNRFELTVNLPADTYSRPQDGLYVAIHWATNFNQWNVYVYGPGGSLVASGDGVDSNGQAVLIPHASNGRYTIVAAPASAEQMTFTGEARILLDHKPRTPPEKSLAPRLSTTPPHDFHLACPQPDPTSTTTRGGCVDVPPIGSHPTGWRWGGAWMNSCYTDETARPATDARRCLRFSNTIRNTGDGPLILRAELTQGAVPGQCRMHQLILQRGGGTATRDAGACEFHAAHGHFHYLNTSQYSLIPAPDDAITRPNLRETPIAQTRKLGYCLVDIDLWADITDSSRLSARTWSFPTCDAPSETASQGENRIVQEMGISTGWGDIYTWDLPGQYLDITDIADGIYDVVSVANPDCSLVESVPGQETAATRIRLEGGVVSVIAEFGGLPVPGCSVPRPPSAAGS